MDMHATINAKDLTSALAAIKPAIRKNTPLPITAHVHVASSPDAMQLSATDLDKSLSISIPARVTGAEDVTLEPAAMLAALRGVKGTVSLSVNGTARLQAGALSVTVPTMPAADFPLLGPAGEPLATVDSAELLGAFSRVAIAAADDDTRPMLTAVRLEFESGTLTLVATDGFRLHRAELPCSFSGELGLAVNMPADSCLALVKACKGQTGPASIFIAPNRNQIHVTIGAVHMISRLIEGNYVNWRRIVPTKHTTTWHVDGPALRAFLTAAVKSTPRKDHPYVRLVTGPDALHLSDQTGLEAEIPTLFEGAELARVDLNARYLLDVLTDDYLVLELTGANNAVTIAGHVIMPAHLPS